jgi:hypothetical protein
MLAQHEGAQLDPTACRLRTANKKGQPGNVVLNETQTLSQLGLQSNNVVFLEAQKVCFE